MEVAAHDAFMAMYYALEAATDEYTDPGLKTLVEDADPFVWKDRLSADPAVWAEFSKEFSENYGEGDVSPEEARSFCRHWLTKQGQKHEFYQAPLVEAFDSVATPQDWEAVLAEL